MTRHRARCTVESAVAIGWLWAVAWLQLGLLAAMLVAALLDSRQVLEITTPGSSPMKFASSIAVYVWTVTCMLGDLRGARAGW